MTRAQALVFDFDGVIVETTDASYRSWLDLFEEHGVEFPHELWCAAIGGGIGVFDALADLEAKVAQPIDRETLKARRIARLQELVADLPPREGVRDYLAAARELGLKTAIATNASSGWTASHLDRLRIDGWHCLSHCEGELRPKPAPDVYLSALEALGVPADAAIAIEDSPNGIRAAKAAGLCCVAFPHPYTASLDLSAADLVVASLADVPLETLLDRLGFTR